MSQILHKQTTRGIRVNEYLIQNPFVLKILGSHVLRKLRAQGIDLDDLNQESVVELLKRQDKYDPSKGALSTFVSTVVQHSVSRHFRKKRIATTSLKSYHQKPVQRETPYIPLHKLTPGCREIIRQRYLEGSTLRSLADSRGVTYQALQNIVRRGLNTLRKEMSR